MKVNYNRSTILLIFFLFLTKIGKAQYYENIIPLSPNASTLGEYRNAPISLSTGTPDISIPIWEIKGKQLSLPISISYGASCSRIEEQVALYFAETDSNLVVRIGRL